jgi:small subunit ribosomal protein S6
LFRGKPEGRRNPALRAYELIIIFNPELDESAFKEMIEKVQGWITDSGGQIQKIDIWGKRQLAYPIHKQKEGQYVLFQSQIDPAYCSELERQLRIQESVLRYLLAVQES